MGMLTAELTSTELITPYLGIFKFRPEQPIPFTAGQYVTLGVRRPGLEGPGVRIQEGKGTVLRPYSVASSPHEDIIELYIAWVQQDGRGLNEWGILSTELFKRADDQEFLFMPKAKGRFMLPEDTRDVIMVATGTGIAPFVSILRYCNCHSDSVGDRRFIVIHGVSRNSDLAYRDELQHGYDLNVEYIQTVSREATNGYNKKYAEELFINRNDKTGRLTAGEVDSAIQNGSIHGVFVEELLGRELDPRHSVVMLCGNPAMIENVKKITEARGFQLKLNLITEEYW